MYNESSSFSALQAKMRMLAYGFKIESIPSVASAPSTTPSSNFTGPSEEPIPHPQSPSTVESVQDAAALERLAIVSLEMGKCAEAKEKLEKVLKFKERYYGCGSAQLAWTINSLAEAHLGLGDFLSAKHLCEKPLITEPDDVTSVDIVCTLGITYMEVGRFEEAIVELEGAWERLSSKSTLSEDGQLLKAKILSSLGIIYCYLDNVEKAKKAANSCAAIFDSYEFSLNNEDRVYRIKCYLANALLLSQSQSDDHEKGLEQLRTCLKYFESNYGLNHYKYVEALHFLVCTSGCRVEWKKGLKILERCVEQGKHCYGDDNIATVKLLHSLGQVYFALNDQKKAVEVFEKALKIVDQFRCPLYEMHRRHSLMFLVGVWEVLGDYVKIKRALQICLGIEKNQKSAGRKLTKSVWTLGALDNVYSKLGYEMEDVEFLENNLADEKRLRHRAEFTEDLVISHKILGKAYGEFGYKAKEREMNEAALEIEKGLRRGW